MDTEKYKGLYVTEAHRHLCVLEDTAEALRNATVDTESWERAARAAHTLRGMSATMGCGQLAQLAGSLETLFGDLETGTAAGNRELAVVLDDCLSTLRELVGQVADGEAQDVDLTPLLRRMKAPV